MSDFTAQLKWVLVRKPRRCFGCCIEYPIKTRMHYWAGVFEGDFSSTYLYEQCEAAHSKNYFNGEAFGEGDLKEFWMEEPKE